MAKDDPNDTTMDAFKVSLVLVLLGGAVMGWLVGGNEGTPRWSDTASGVLYAACIYVGALAIISFQIDDEANGSGDLKRAMKVQIPWVLLAIVIAGWLVESGRGVNWG